MGNKNPHYELIEICKASSTLKNLLTKTHYLAQLTALVKVHLTQPLRDHVSVANYRDHCLILAVDNAVWMTELRYTREALLATIQAKIIPSLNTLEWIIVNKI